MVKRIWIFEIYTNDGHDIEVGTVSGAESRGQVVERLKARFRYVQPIGIYEVSPTSLRPGDWDGCSPKHLRMRLDG